MQFTRGQKSKLSALTPGQQVEIGVRVAGGGHEGDTVLCVVLGPDQKVVDAQAVIGAHQPTGGGGFIVWQGAKDGDTGVFWVDLAQIPTGQRLAIVVGGNGQPYSALSSGQVRISAAGGGEVMTFPFRGSDFSGEKAVIVTELYVKDEWRVAAMGHGFNDGLTALLAGYGAGPIAGAAAPAPPPAAPAAAPPPAPPPPPPAAPPPAAPPPAAPPPAAPPPAAPAPSGLPPATSLPTAAPPPAAAASPPAAAAPAAPVNLGKVTLTKQGEQRSVSLQKGAASRPIHINLNWQASGGKRRGFLSGRSSAPDLDLGCMFELDDGRKSVIQPLGGNFGSPDGPPWIHLDKDDRSGGAADGENLFLIRPEHLSRVMIFAMIYEGAPDFMTVGGYLSILDQDGQLTQIVLDNPDANRTFCAVALITTKADQVVIQKEERYFRHAEEADNYYGFGFNWRAGSKD